MRLLGGIERRQKAGRALNRFARGVRVCRTVSDSRELDMSVCQRRVGFNRGLKYATTRLISKVRKSMPSYVYMT